MNENEPKAESDVIARWRHAYDAQPPRTRLWIAALAAAIVGVLAVYIALVREIVK